MPLFARRSSNQGRVSDSARRWKLVWSYLPDWVLTIALWAVFYALDKVDGYRRLFSVTDTSLAHPYAEHERVPVWLLAVLCGIVPGVLIILMGSIVQRSFWDVHCGILGLILGLGLGQTFTTFIKITAGRPRPDLFSRCQLPDSLTENPLHGLTSWTVCTETDKLQDGFRSFPSGHSSFAWTGMWYLILYSAAKFRLLNRHGHTWKSWVLLAPLSCSALISVSRTMDYRHHPTDVIGGAIIGILTAWLSYRQFYPAISDLKSYKPYSPRIPRDEEVIPLHRRNDSGDPQAEQRAAEDYVRASLIPAKPNRIGGSQGTSDPRVQDVRGARGAVTGPRMGDSKYGRGHTQAQSPQRLERSSEATLNGNGNAYSNAV